ncbi:MAG: DUF4406 domain-containing protein [Paramuribaculum sp.]|nr:DUF4406 domain-containing protein [Paramuribaculum sp.]
MKIYISIPISGHKLDKVHSKADAIKQQLIADGHEAITPFDVCSEPDKSYAYYMGRDIEAMLGCDAIYLCDGWQDSRGCQAEAVIAKIYEKQIFPFSEADLINP